MRHILMLLLVAAIAGCVSVGSINADTLGIKGNVNTAVGAGAPVSGQPMQAATPTNAPASSAPTQSIVAAPTAKPAVAPAASPSLSSTSFGIFKGSGPERNVGSITVKRGALYFHVQSSGKILAQLVSEDGKTTVLLVDQNSPINSESVVYVATPGVYTLNVVESATNWQIDIDAQQGA